MVGGGAKHCFALKWLADSISDFPFHLYSFSLCAFDSHKEIYKNSQRKRHANTCLLFIYFPICSVILECNPKTVATQNG